MAWWFGFLPNEDQPSLTGRTVVYGPYETSEQANRKRSGAKGEEVTLSEPFEAQSYAEAQSLSDTNLAESRPKKPGAKKRPPSLVSFE